MLGEFTCETQTILWPYITNHVTQDSKPNYTCETQKRKKIYTSDRKLQKRDTTTLEDNNMSTPPDYWPNRDRRQPLPVTKEDNNMSTPRLC